MSNILRQFKIKGTLADIVDIEARSELADQSEFTSTIQSEVESEALAISELGSEVESQSAAYSEAIAGLEEDKQNVSSAWKIEKTSGQVQLTVAAGGTARLSIPNSKGLSAYILSVRSADKTRTLVPINTLEDETTFTVLFYNVGSSAYSSETMTLEVTYAYQ